MTTAEVLDHVREPIVIYRSVNRDGQTFTLDPLSRDRVRSHFGGQVHLHPRVFIAHETAADYDTIRGDLVAQVVQLLTGLTRARLDPLGEVSIRDSETEIEVPTRD